MPSKPKSIPIAPTLNTLSRLEHVLPEGTRLLPFDLVLIELLRQRKSDAFLRGVLNLSGPRLAQAVATVRDKLRGPHHESVAETAERRGVPRINGLG